MKINAQTRHILKRIHICVLSVLLTVFFAYIITNVVLVLAVNGNKAKGEELYNNGPWSGEAVWKDEDEKLYLVCTRNEANGNYTDVTAYIYVNDEWISAKCWQKQKTCIVSFDSPDGKHLFEARALLKDTMLTLKDFVLEQDLSLGGAFDSLSDGCKEIKLSKYPLDEKILPFEIDKK